ncbi:MAG: hypothetical protein P0S93_01625 [Candidatus Neptunochlamydia sp.]|nr:hypothetical protein [Candidatus Neptunochlamydia sp.]
METVSNIKAVKNLFSQIIGLSIAEHIRDTFAGLENTDAQKALLKEKEQADIDAMDAYNNQMMVASKLWKH